MQEDAHTAVRALLVPKRVLYLGLAAGGGAREVVVSHRGGDVTAEVDLVVDKLHIRPALASVDCEAGVLVVALINRTVCK